VHQHFVRSLLVEAGCLCVDHPASMLNSLLTLGHACVYMYVAGTALVLEVSWAKHSQCCKAFLVSGCIQLSSVHA